MKKTTRTYNIILTLLFLCLILFCFLNDLFVFYKVPEISATENRRLASKPVFDLSNLDPYPKLYENYFNDQFPFRKDISLLNTLICFFVFHQSPLPGTVETGKHGWLFFDQKESIVYQGKFDLSDRQVKALVSELHNRAIDMRNKGIRYYVAFPPMKPEIYPEYLPPDFSRARDGTVTDKIVDAIKKDTVIHYIDIKEALLRAKIHGRLYNQTDNHWNRIGSFYGYTEIINTIRKDFPRVKPVTRSDFSFRIVKRPAGNLANMIGLSKYLTEVEFDPEMKKSRTRSLPPYHHPPKWMSNSGEYEQIWETGDPTLPNMVIIRDSYTNALKPYLNESFNKITYIFDEWKYRENSEIIDDVKPDIVLLIIFEPHISHVIGIP
jgi:alginate O-acetyltransferase complex protein AlgJ